MPVASSFAIRPAVTQDIEELTTIDAHCFPTGIAYSRQEIASLLRMRNGLTIVTERSHIIAGFASLLLTPSPCISKNERRAELITIDVLPEFRRMGIGRRLHNVLQESARAAGASSIMLHVALDNAAAIRLYETLGYRILQITPRYYLNAIDARKMEKLLT